MRGFVQSLAVVMIVALAGCNSAESLLSSVRSDPATPQGTQPGQTPSAQTPAPAPSIIAAVRPVPVIDAKVNIAPIVGAPLEAVTALSRSMNQRARETGLSLVGAGEASATHVVKGYFSALAEESGTTVIYVWDVIDPTGKRLHRIQGQKTAGGSNEADAWSAVSADTMQAIGASSIDQLNTWLGS